MYKTEKEIKSLLSRETPFDKEVDGFIKRAEDTTFTCCQTYLRLTKDLYELVKRVHNREAEEMCSVRSKITLKNDAILHLLLDTVELAEQLLKKGTAIGRPPKKT
jgi:hypothetical protein